MYGCKSANNYSKPFLANQGVKQGDSLSLLFLIYLLMILENISKVVILILLAWTTKVLTIYYMQMI